jgi:anti-anti-sigma factor
VKDISPAVRSAVCTLSGGEDLRSAQTCAAEIAGASTQLLASVARGTRSHRAGADPGVPCGRAPEPLITVWIGSSTATTCPDAPLPVNVLLIGELDACTGERVRLPMRSLVGDRRDVVVDLSCVSFIDCAGLRTLESVRDEVDDHGQRVSFHRPSRAVRRLLQIVRDASTLSIGATISRPNARDRARARKGDGCWVGPRHPDGGPTDADSAERSP